MFVKLPTVKKEWDEDNKKLVVTRSDMLVDIDTSFKAHLKWEEQFALTLSCDLSTYTERVRSWLLNPVDAKAQLIGILKLLYCYINSQQLPTFKDFVGLFDIDVAEEILQKIRIVLEEVGKTASKN